MRTGPGGPSATTDASGTPGTSPACPEDSQERTRPGREGSWTGAGGCVGGAAGGGASLVLGLWVRSECCPKGLGLARASQASAGSEPECGGAAYTPTWRPPSGAGVRARGFLQRNVSSGTRAICPTPPVWLSPTQVVTGWRSQSCGKTPGMRHQDPRRPFSGRPRSRGHLREHGRPSAAVGGSWPRRLRHLIRVHACCPRSF